MIVVAYIRVAAGAVWTVARGSSGAIPLDISPTWQHHCEAFREEKPPCDLLSCSIHSLYTNT